MLKLYGTSKSRTARCLWAMGELGLKFEHIPVVQAQTHTPEHLRLNPNGHIPVLDDDGQIIIESLAINMYLAEAYGRAPMWPATVRQRAALYQWTLWSQTEVECNFSYVIRNRRIMPPEQRSEVVVAQAMSRLPEPLQVLENHLAGRPYLLDGTDFTIADLNVAGVISSLRAIDYDLAQHKAISGWLERCLGREANQKARAMP